jgi:hypothetical protein
VANTVRILITAKDEISGQLDKIRDKATLLSKTDIGKGMAQGAGIAAFGMLKSAAFGALDAVVEFGKGSIRAAMDEEKSVARLNATLKANVSSWDGTTDAIEKRIAASVRLGFTDDDLRDSFNVLVAATKDVNQAFAIQRTAMDLARFKGISLADASSALVKVEAGQYRMLKSLGIELKEGATQTEALAAVQKLAAGQTEAYTKTLAGQVDVLSAKMSDLQDRIGAGLTPALTTATEALSSFLDAFESDSPAALADAVADFGRALAPNALEITHWSDVAAGKFSDTAKSANDGARYVGKAMGDMEGAIEDVGDETKDYARVTVRSLGRTQKAWTDFREAMIDDAQQLIDDAFDPLIAQDNLLAATAEVNAARRVIASGKATKAEMRDARETLHSAGKDQAEYLLELAEAGKTGSKAYKDGIKSLKETIRTSTGPTKVYLQGVLDKLLEIESTGKVVPITFVMRYTGKSLPGLHAGGRVGAGQPVIVGEERAEVFVPDRSGTILPRVPSGGGHALGNSLGGAASLTINVSTPVMTPGAAQALADTIAPSITRWQQDRRLLAGR